MALGKSNGKVLGKKKTRRQKRAEDAERLAPPEEKAQVAANRSASGGANHEGAIIVGTGALTLPKGFASEGLPESEQRRLPHPAVLMILALFLLFILFIAYQISKAPPRDTPAPGRLGYLRGGSPLTNGGGSS